MTRIRLTIGSTGFTLIELMIVICILGILAAISIPMFMRMLDNAKEASTKTNMHTVQISAEDYGVQNDGRYPVVMDATHIADVLPSSFKNPFSGLTGNGASWENRENFAGDANPVSGIVSYADSGTGFQYNIKGYGKNGPLTVVLMYGQ